jgi:myosin heavy subunit
MLDTDGKKKRGGRAGGNKSAGNMYKLKQRRPTAAAKKEPVPQDKKRVEVIAEGFRKRGLIGFLDNPPKLAIGLTKVFMKQELSIAVEAARHERIDWAANTIGKAMPMMKTLNEYNDQQALIRDFRTALKNEEVERLVALLRRADALLPHNGSHMTEVRDARRLHKVHKDWIKAFEGARDGKIMPLKVKITEAHKRFAHIIERAKQFVKDYKEVNELCIKAVVNPDRPELLTDALKRVEDLDLRTKEAKEAQAVHEQLRWEQQGSDEESDEGEDSAQWKSRRSASVSNTVTMGTDGVMRNSDGTEAEAASIINRRGSLVL